MRPKSGLPKRKAIRAVPIYDHGFIESTESREAEKLREPTQIRAVSFFSGCGGLDLGVRGGFTFLGTKYNPLPIKIIAAYDNDERSVDTYRLNLGDHIHQADLTSVGMSDVPAADMLLGGFPCQDFSSSGPKTGLEGKRGRLFQVMVDYMFLHQPRIVVAENVKHLARMSGGAVLAHIIERLEEPGYTFDVWTLNCPDFGLPQSRTRLFLVGIRNDDKRFPIKPTFKKGIKPVTIREAISDLERIHDETVPNQSQRFVATKATGGAGQGDQVSMADKVGYCVRANPKGRIQFHYRLDRRLTVRECARLQSFPDSFVFPHSATANIMQIGNAVPPIVGHRVATSILDFVNGTSARPRHEFKNLGEQPSLFDAVGN